MKKIVVVLLSFVFLNCSKALKKIENENLVFSEIFYGKNYEVNQKKVIYLKNQVLKEKKYYGIINTVDEIIDKDTNNSKLGVIVGKVQYKNEEHDVVRFYKKYIQNTSNLETNNKKIHPYGLLYNSFNKNFLTIEVEGIDGKDFHLSEKNKRELDRAILKLNFKKIQLKKAIILDRNHGIIRESIIKYEGIEEGKIKFIYEEFENIKHKNPLISKVLLFDLNEKFIQLNNTMVKVDGVDSKSISITFLEDNLQNEYLKSKNIYEIDDLEEQLMPSAPGLTPLQGTVLGITSLTPIGGSINIIKTINRSLVNKTQEKSGIKNIN